MEVDTNVISSPATGPAGKKTKEASGGRLASGSATTVTDLPLAG